MLTLKPIPSPIMPSEVMIDEKAPLDFSFLPNHTETDKPKADKLEIYKIAEGHLALKINELTIANQVSKKEGWLNSFIPNILARFFDPATNTKDAIHKQAIELCQKETQANWKQAETSITQAEHKLLTLKSEYEQVKQAVSTIEQLLKDTLQTKMTNIEKINANLNEIKAIEPALEPAFARIHFTVQAAKAIDPSLIKQVFDPSHQSIEDIVLNKENYVNNIDLLISASKLLQNSETILNQLNKTLQEKLAAYNKIETTYDAYIKSIVDPDKTTVDQITQHQKLKVELQQSVVEYNTVQDQIKAIAHAKDYVYYHKNWSTLAQEDINTAKIIQARKQENIDLHKTIESLSEQPQKFASQTEKLVQTESEIKEQEKIIADNQVIFKTQHEIAEGLKAMILKSELSVAETETQFDNTDSSNLTLPVLLTESLHVEGQF